MLARRLRLLWRARRALRGAFQPYSHTLPDRYPWLFAFVRTALGAEARPRVLSFGCSGGDELVSLAAYLPQARLKGIDVNPENIDRCIRRALPGVELQVAADTRGEPDGTFDAIFCLAVLCHGDLAVYDATQADPLLHFADFERVVVDFARCLRPSGLLILHTTNFRFCDTACAGQFEVLLRARLDDLAPDAVFDRNNRRIEGERYRDVVFRKRAD